MTEETGKTEQVMRESCKKALEELEKTTSSVNFWFNLDINSGYEMFASTVADHLSIMAQDLRKPTELPESHS